MKDLKKVLTKDLVDELRKRDCVDGFSIEPYDPYMVMTKAMKDEPFTQRSNTGPVQILIVKD